MVALDERAYEIEYADVVDAGSGGTAIARHSLFGRYMKAQLRLAGDRRKLGRNGLSSDRPRECVDPPENLRNLRNLFISPQSTESPQSAAHDFATNS